MRKPAKKKPVWEGSAKDDAMDKKMGVKEGDARDKKMDAKGQAALNAKKKKKKAK